MGLDGVELVMAVEEEFDIVIDDADAEKIQTPRNLIDHVASKVGCVDREYCSTQRAFHRLRASLMRHCGLKRAQIRPRLPMNRLLPFKDRRQIVHQLLDEIGITAVPLLVRPRWLIWLIVILSLAMGVLAAEWVSNRIAQPGSTGFVWSFMAFGAVATLLGSAAAFVTRPLRYHFEPAFASVGNFSRWMVITSPQTFGGPTCEWTRDQIAEKVRAICIEQLGLSPETYREDADFVKDLGVG